MVNALARVKNHNGADVSSSFKVMVYQQKAPSTQISNITEQNNLNDRQVGTDIVRPINTCPSNETFIESKCTPQDDKESSLQAYSYTCRKVVEHWSVMTGEYLGRRPAYRTRQGHCEPIEMCVDGFAPNSIASCVHTSLFDDYMIDKDGQIKGMLSGKIFDVETAYAVVSKMDKSTPMGVDSLRIGAWMESSVLAKGSVQSKKCRNCVELETDKLRPDTDSLKVEATLLSTGAVAGILWLALSSG